MAPSNDIIREAVIESISGILSEQRARARARGTTHLAFRVSVPLTDILQLVNVRLIGAYDDESILPDLPALTAHLEALGVCIVGDSAELVVNLPSPRSAHAR